MPDQFVMSKNEYYASFPYDVYADEDQPQKWAPGEKVVDVNDTTRADGKWLKVDGNGKKEPGYYKIIVITKDKFGEEVKAEKIIRIIDEKKPAMYEAVLVDVKNRTVEPGQMINYDIHTGFDKIWLIQNLTKTGKTHVTSYADITATSPYRNEITVSENDRGGINMNYAFVQHNRVYTGTESFNVPLEQQRTAGQL
jgi:hypothetical protein